MNNNYLEYAKAFDASEKVIAWIKSNLKNYLEKTKKDIPQDEVEHILDYLIMEGSSKNLELMSYPEAKKNTEIWTKKQIKKGEHIKELPTDTEIIYDFKDGFKIVKLIGKNAYEREGYLMSNCVASYYGNSKEIYSLRDKDNTPHCTMEKDQQVKGKGNGNIHPKYVGYVVKFLEKVGMTVGDSEMAHLGYLNVTKFKKYLSEDTKYFNKVYVYEQDKLVDKEGKEFASLDLLDVKPLIKETDTELKINFDLKTFIPLSIDFLLKHSKKIDKGVQSTSGNYSKNASSGYYSQNASSGDYSKNASSGDSSQNASSGDYSQNASSGDYSQNASSGKYSQNASSGKYSSIEMTGKHNVGANIGVGGKIKGIIGSWITLAEYNDEYECIYVKSAKIDGKKIKADTWYILKNKKFTEFK